MTKRLISWTPGGVATYWHETSDGWAIEVVQDTTDLLDFNVETQNHYDTRWSDGDTKMVARIPPVVAEIWRQHYGLDIYSRDPDVQRKIDELLNSSDWYKLRTDRSVL